MAIRLPIDSATPNYRIGVSLDDVPYIMDIRWNGRDESWYMDLYDTVESPIRLGIKIVLGMPLGGRVLDERRPAGSLFAADLSGEGREATVDDLGSRVVIFYVPQAEIQAYFDSL